MKQNLTLRSPVKSLTSSNHAQQTLTTDTASVSLGLWPTLLLVPLLCSAAGLGPFPQPQATPNTMDTTPKIRPGMSVHHQLTAVVVSTISVVFCALTIKPEVLQCKILNNLCLYSESFESEYRFLFWTKNSCLCSSCDTFVLHVLKLFQQGLLAFSKLYSSLWSLRIISNWRKK